ncbi:uncharacterized protein LOC124963046 isoform X2 [Sciurus carolinensis]|uniref:uncharacterized protein LOC124963046 isoform X2 n=1 Tax=Sciurus carolinensis TaxID=30640 RepID=UPI001FB2ED7F|nr:uncharacterized protein LOC124963046 isoform X2 [Sciurus carolinensis]
MWFRVLPRMRPVSCLRVEWKIAQGGPASSGPIAVGDFPRANQGRGNLPDKAIASLSRPGNSQRQSPEGSGAATHRSPAETCGGAGTEVERPGSQPHTVDSPQTSAEPREQSTGSASRERATPTRSPLQTSPPAPSHWETIRGLFNLCDPYSGSLEPTCLALCCTLTLRYLNLVSNDCSGQLSGLTFC